MTKKVLIVEDDMSLQKILAQKLGEAGIAVVSANTGQAAITHLKTDKPDLILLDIMLPGGMNGFDFLEQIKADKAYKSIPVIVLTSLDTEMKTALDIGVVDYIVKANMALDEVVLKIKNHLQ